MGATPYEGGVEVRVWAPNARAVAVVGEVAGAAGRRALSAEAGTGMFAARIDGACAGQKYRLAITGQDGVELLRIDPRSRMIDGGDSVVVEPRAFAWKTTSFKPPAREASVIYEMHVGSFNVSDASTGGTFASARDKLDALVDLGVTTVELMPVNGHSGGHGWGYGPQQWFAPHAAYGSPDELKRFIDEAHARGIAVVLDVVYNHYDGWSQAPLHCFDGTCPGTSAGIYFFDQEPYRATPWGPRPDFAKKEVADFFADNVFAWTTEYKVDGFRHDSVSNIRGIDGQGAVPGGAPLLRRMNEVTLAANPASLIMAEDLKGEASVTGSIASGGLGFASQWDGGFQWAIASAASAASDEARNLGAVRDSLLGTYNGDAMQRVLYVESHDTAGNDGARLPVRIDAADPTSYAARKRALLAAGLLLTAPGVPMLFQGQEMLEDVKFAPQPSALDWAKANGQAQVRAFYKDMIRLRRDLDGVSGGLRGKHIAITHLNEGGGNKVLVYRRWSKSGDDVVVVANFGGRRYTRYELGVPGAGAWQARVDSDATRYGADFGASVRTAVGVVATPRDGLPATASIVLGPYSIVVLTR
jgi:1,4-alpha-glucan branching enzyme